ncbi:MAG TPA: phosphoglucosamine mutase [Chthoniobacterales bacterium]|jgi:phosphoglucosamine mutase
MQKLFGTDGVRGIANVEPITVESALRLVQSAARVLAKEESYPVVIVGRDTRASGEMLESAIAAGLAASGVHVLLAGIIPTPAVAFLVPFHSALFGIMITASHNPFQDNGIKFFGANGYKLSDELELAIESEYFSSAAPRRAIGKSIGRIRQIQEATEQYVAFAASTVPKDFSLPGIKVLVDSANGAAYRTTPIVLSKLGAEVDLRFGTPDGFNINLDCGSTHPSTLSRLVQQSGAAFGIAHDGDADRVLFCDEQGVPLDGDELLAIAAADLLARNQLRGNTLVATVMSNFGLDEVLRRNGGKVLRTDVGDRFVIDAMVQHQLNFGGEQSGHLIFRDFSTTGDGLIAALQIMAIMVRTGKTLGELRQILHKFPQVLRNLTVREKLPFEQFGGLIKRVAEAESRLHGKGRVLLRYSGTEPKARLLLEGPDADELNELAEGIVRELAKNLGA